MKALFAVCLIALLVSGCKSTCYSEKTCSILDKMEKATDPLGKLADIDTVTIKGKIRTTTKGAADITIQFKKPNLMRLDLKITDKARIIKAYDGKTGWKFSSIHGYEELQGNSLDELKLQAAYLPPYANLKDVFSTLETKGTAIVTGTVCDKLIGTPKKEFNSQPITMFIDQKTSLLLKTNETQDMQNQKIPVTTIYQTYKVFNNIKMATLLISEANGDIMEMRIDDVIWNTPISISAFDPPEDLN